MLTTYLRWRERRLEGKQDPHRRVEAMDVGLELLVNEADRAEPLAALRNYSVQQRQNSGAFFEPSGSAMAFHLEGDRLSFESPIRTGIPAQDRVVCRLFETGTRERAVILIPHWNSTSANYDRFGRFLRRSGIAAACISLPYHDHRRPESPGLDTQMVSANLGRTIRSWRQAVLETRLAIGWLEQRGYQRIGVVGCSLGSSIASIAAAHDQRVRAAALVMTAGQFGEVVWTSRATQHIRSALEGRLKLEQLNDVWSLISPISYVERLGRRGVPTLILSGREDTVFQPYLTARFVAALREQGVPCWWKIWPCGHYTMGKLPFSAAVLTAVAGFLRKRL